jgi:hypothetical protein
MSATKSDSLFQEGGDGMIILHNKLESSPFTTTLNLNQHPTIGDLISALDPLTYAGFDGGTRSEMLCSWPISALPSSRQSFEPNFIGGEINLECELEDGSKGSYLACTVDYGTDQKFPYLYVLAFVLDAASRKLLDYACLAGWDCDGVSDTYEASVKDSESFICIAVGCALEQNEDTYTSPVCAVGYA